MFANSQAQGTNLASTDVCNTPSASGVTPVTYVNTAMCSAATGFSTTVLFDSCPAHNTSTSVSTSSGDEAGVSGGVVSGTFMSSCRFVAGSTKVMVGSQPATRLTSSTIQNSSNGSGSTISPSQTKVLLLG